MNWPLRERSVPQCDKGYIENASKGTNTMDILARRLTIITLLMAIFAIMLAAAVETDYRRSTHNTTGKLVACATPQACTASL